MWKKTVSDNDMKQSNDLGVLGEDTFKKWCSSVGLVANRSHEDKTGWDFYVEFPCKKTEGAPIDMQPTPLECKIQVKATKNRYKKIAIKISNLNRLIRTQMPVFICIIEYDEKDQEQSAYLVHIWKDIIGRTLKRMRELDVNGTGNELNKKTITIGYGNNEKLKVINGESIRKAIEICVPNGIEKYLEKKNEFLSNLGFENGAKQFTFTVSGKENFEALLDMALGINKKVILDKFVAYDKRFGILSNTPSFDEGDGELYFPDIKPYAMVKVKFKEQKLSPGVSFESKLYTSPLNRVVPKEFARLRIEGVFFNIVWTPFKNEFKINFSLGFEKRLTLKELREILYVLNIFKNSPNGVIMEFVMENHPFRFNINQDVNKMIDFSYLSSLYNISDMSLNICQKLRVPENDISVSINDLYRHSESIKKYFQIIFGNEKIIKLIFSIDKGDYNGESKIVYLKFFKTNIGNKVVGCVIGFIGMPTFINESEYQYELIPERLTIGPTLVAEEGEIIDNDEVNGIIEKFSEQFCKKDYFPIVSNKSILI